MDGHRTNYKQYLAGNHNYITSFEILKYDDAVIRLVEECPCENKEQLLRREGQIQQQTENCVNKHIAGRTQRETYQANKNIRLQYQADYYHTNKEILCDKNKEYREANREVLNSKARERITCECGCEIAKSSNAKHRNSQKHINLMQAKNTNPVESN